MNKISREELLKRSVAFTAIRDMLRVYTQKRNIYDKPFNLEVETGNLYEEIGEYLKDYKSDYKRLDAACDVVVFSLNAIKYLEIELKQGIFNNNNSTFTEELLSDKTTDVIFDIAYRVTQCGWGGMSNKDDKLLLAFRLNSVVLMARQLIIDMGYSFEACMIETIKEISSRKQEPLQKLAWADVGVEGKFKKDLNQDPDTLYVADYDNCKIPTPKHLQALRECDSRSATLFQIHNIGVYIENNFGHTVESVSIVTDTKLVLQFKQDVLLTEGQLESLQDNYSFLAGLDTQTNNTLTFEIEL